MTARRSAQRRREPSRGRDAPCHFGTLPNGLRVVHRPMPHAQSVAVGMWAQAGGRYEPLPRMGLSHFLEHLLFKGTRQRSCEALKQQIEGVGGVLNGFTAEEFTCYMAKVPSRHWRRPLTILSDMVCRSRMSANDIEKEREVIIEEIRMYEDAPGQLVHDLFSELLWPRHPLGMLLSGSIETVRRISRRDLVQYWRRMYQPRGLLVSCAGALETDAMMRHLRRVFGRGVTGPAARRFARAPRPRRGPQVRIWKKDTEQTHLCLGTYAMPRTHPDRFALELLHIILGANMSSRLFREVREKRGLAYEIGTHVKRFNDTGAFVVSAGCDAAKLRATLQTIYQELARVRRSPVAASELHRAKEYYAGQLIMGLEDTMDHMLWIGEQAVTVGRVARTEKLLDHLSRVSVQDIRRVARALFVRAKMHAAIVGPVAETETARLEALCGL